MSSSSEEAVVKKRVTRKRADASSASVKKVAKKTTKKEKTATAESTPKLKKKTASKKVAKTKKIKSDERIDLDNETGLPDNDSIEIVGSQLEEKVNTMKSNRKAPTTIAVTKGERRRFPFVTVVVLIIALGIGGTGIWYGMNDPGQIDVETLVKRHNERVARGEAEGGQVGSVSLPVQRPNLRPSTVQPGVTPDVSEVNNPVDSEEATNATTSENSTEESSEGLESDEPNTTTSNTNEQSEDSDMTEDNSSEVSGEADTSYRVERHLTQRQPLDLM